MSCQLLSFRSFDSRWRSGRSCIPRGIGISMLIQTAWTVFRQGRSEKHPENLGRRWKTLNGDKDLRFRTSDLHIRFVVLLPTSVPQKAFWCVNDFCLSGKRRRGDIDISLQRVMSHAFSLAGHGGNVVRPAAADDYMGIQLSD